MPIKVPWSPHCHRKGEREALLLAPPACLRHRWGFVATSIGFPWRRVDVRRENSRKRRSRIRGTGIITVATAAEDQSDVGRYHRRALLELALLLEIWKGGLLGSVSGSGSRSCRSLCRHQSCH
ncbi:hypothetical protein AHAS_Ahas03G0230700 [Arachis hypogaea]